MLVLILLATGAAILLVSLQRSRLSVDQSGIGKNIQRHEYDKDAIISRVLQEIKEKKIELEAKDPPQTLLAHAANSLEDMDNAIDQMFHFVEADGNYIPERSNQPVPISYEVFVRDNFERVECGEAIEYCADLCPQVCAQDYLVDNDDAFLVKVRFDTTGRKESTLIMVGPGEVDSPGPVPAAAVGCFSTEGKQYHVHLGQGDVLSGFDKNPPGVPSPPSGNPCADVDGCVPGKPHDKAAASTNGTPHIVNKKGTAEGNPLELQVDDDVCEQLKEWVDLVEAVFDVGDSEDLVFYESTSGTKTVPGDHILGTLAQPKFTLIRTPAGKDHKKDRVRFTGDVEGSGIMVVQGNAEFAGDFTYYGIVIVDNTDRSKKHHSRLWLTGNFHIFGALIVTEVIENNIHIGKSSGDYIWWEHNDDQQRLITYSNWAIQNVLEHSDPTHNKTLFNLQAYQQLR